MHFKHDTALPVSYWGESSHSLDTSPQVSTMWHRHKLSVVSKVCEYTHLYKESYVSWLILSGQHGPEDKSHNVLVPAWLLVPEFLDQRAQYFLLNPSFVQGPTVTLLTLPSTPNSLASESLPPSCLLYPHSPQSLSFDPPKHDVVTHSYHRCTLYIPYFLPGISFLLLLTILERSHIVYR